MKLEGKIQVLLYLDKKKKVIEEEIKELKQEIIDEVKEGKTEIGSFEVNKYSVSGKKAVNYKGLLDDLDIEFPPEKIEEFTKVGKGSINIKIKEL